MPVRKLVSGTKLSIFFWATDKEGLKRELFDCPNVSAIDRQKMLKTLKRHAEEGFPKNPEKFKKLEGEKKIYEIKPTSQFRLLGGFFDKNFIVVLCIKKKQDRIAKADLKKAKDCLELYYAERN